MNIKLSKEQRAQLVSQVQAYFEMERGEVIGELAADQFVSFMIKTVGPSVYNQALQDTRKMLNDRFMAIEDELYALEKHRSFR